MDDEVPAILTSAGLQSYFKIFEVENNSVEEEDLKGYELERSTEFYGESDAFNRGELDGLSILLPMDESLNDSYNNKKNDSNAFFTVNTEEGAHDVIAHPTAKKFKRATVSCSPTSTKIDMDSAFADIARSKVTPKEELQAFLKTFTAGESARTTFEKIGKITAPVRQKLVASVIDNLVIVNGTRLTNVHYKAAAELIVELFPTERVETYYIPPYAERSRQTVSKGKLPYRHRNLKTSMKEKCIKIQEPALKQTSHSAGTIANRI